MKKAKEKLSGFIERIKQEILLYRNILGDKRTTAAAKFLLWAGIAYLLSPIDIIPDFIPVLGQLDDLLIVPMLFYFAILLIPKDIIAEHRAVLRQTVNVSSGNYS